MAEMPLVGEEFAGYRLVSVLGRGGMSIVFRAENPRLGNVIALKVLDPSLATDDIFRTRFLEESRIAASMNHPNVIPIHDMGSSDGLLYIAMRCVTGTDLRQMLKKRGRLQPDTSVFLLEQAARALDAAHRRGLVHRDVKPGNLLVERGNEGSDPDHVYLADFGITKHLGGRTGLTSSGQFLGTIDYVAPEQIRGISVLGLADQYSLGCVLYECLTGRVPFEKDLDAAIIWAHVEEAPTMPTVLRPDLPPAIDDVFARVLAKRPGDRYESCKDFMTAAREALGHMAEPPGSSGSLRSFMPTSGPSSYLTDAPYPAEAPAPYQPAEAMLQYQPTELAHETVDVDAAHAQTSNWPAIQVPPPPPPGRPLPPGPPGGGTRPSRRRGRGPSRALLAGVAALILVAAGAAAITLTLTRGNSGSVAGGATKPGVVAIPSSPGAPTQAGMSMPVPVQSAQSPRTAQCTPSGQEAVTAKNQGKSGPTTLVGVLQEANLCSTPQGDIPTNSCKPTNSTKVICTAPVKGVASVTFQTFPTTSALYSTYQSEIQLLNGSYSQNTKTRCANSVATYSETGWNHLELHPTSYTVAQMQSANFNQVDAMGRQACFVRGGTPYLVWTTDVGNMLAVAQGVSSMAPLYTWWTQVHHVIIFPQTIMCGQNMAHMADAPQGNLISLPTCPTGVTPVTGGPAPTAGGMSSMGGM
ncbi:MAG TPA: serine/threonine-protein kinase [Trebonia sp.]|nr:serine/threonine-protein kinase [Trebonia sp.]